MPSRPEPPLVKYVNDLAHHKKCSSHNQYPFLKHRRFPIDTIVERIDADITDAGNTETAGQHAGQEIGAVDDDALDAVEPDRFTGFDVKHTVFHIYKSMPVLVSAAFELKGQFLVLIHMKALEMPEGEYVNGQAFLRKAGT